MLHQLREAEIEQAAHRGRPISRECDIWLMTNIPVEGLPPAQLMSETDLQEVPPGLLADPWVKLLDLADTRHRQGESILAADLTVYLKISLPTARKYLKNLADRYPSHWLYKKIPQGTRGQPGYGIVPI
jgi:hypothetical protein